jgi:SAM-dependent methyltransferase
VLADLQYRLLRVIAPTEPTHMSGRAFSERGKVRTLLGDAFLEQVRDRDVIDFGCGEGGEALELARHGARVFGVDVRESVLDVARRRALEEGFASVCQFGLDAPEPADIVVSIDAFEHFADPAGVLARMHRLLRPNGLVMAAFGPTWYHPYGGHLFSVFPWAHLLFSESALLRWRSHLRTDGATRFGEVEGGLNQMTIRRFERLLSESPFIVESVELIPIRRLRAVHSSLTREFATAFVRARLRRGPP